MYATFYFRNPNPIRSNRKRSLSAGAKECHAMKCTDENDNPKSFTTNINNGPVQPSNIILGFSEEMPYSPRDISLALRNAKSIRPMFGHTYEAAH